MKKNIKLLNYLLEYDISTESLNEYLEVTETERLDLLNKAFKISNINFSCSDIFSLLIQIIEPTKSVFTIIGFI